MILYVFWTGIDFKWVYNIHDNGNYAANAEGMYSELITEAGVGLRTEQPIFATVLVVVVVKMVFYFTSSVVDPPALLFMGRDKYENEVYGD